MSEHHSEEHHNHIELPAPTPWPIIMAFGFTLAFAGIVTSLVVTGVGVLLVVISTLGLFKDVFPSPQHVYSPIQLPHEQPSAVKTTGRSVRNLHVGEEGHREHVPVKFHSYSSGIYGGLAGGIVMAVLAVAYGLIAEHSIWWTINLLAASALPSMSLADPVVLHEFNAFAFIVALIVHVIFSVLVGLLYAVMLPMLPSKFEWFWGGIVIPLIWTVLIWVSLGTVNPALAQYINWIAFTVCQVAFGLVGGYVVFKSGRIETMQSWSMSMKLGVHAQSPRERKEDEGS